MFSYARLASTRCGNAIFRLQAGALAACLLTCLLGCGQTGPLRLPDETIKPDPTPHHQNKTADE